MKNAGDLIHKRFAMTGLVVLVVAVLLCAGCGEKEASETKSREPEFVQVEIYCGRNMPGGGEVTEEQFVKFLDEVVTPMFPAGLTVYDAYGQMRTTKGVIEKQKTKVLILVFEDTTANNDSAGKIVDSYRQLANGAQVMKTKTTMKPEFFSE